MADNLDKILMYIVDHQLMQSDSRESQIEATATRDVEAEIEGVAQDRHTDAERLAPYFAEGLRQALANGGKLIVNDTDPRDNNIADAFARFLVTPNLATSESHEIGEGHYQYNFNVDLAKLNEIARQAGVTLQGA
jgi:hypothetical protein